MREVTMIEVKVPKAEHMGVHGGGHGELGSCYDRAGGYMLDGLVGKRDGYVLVHGTCWLLDGLPIPCGHAWVLTPSGAVYDGAADRFFDRDSYYAVMHAVEERRYTFEEARRMVLDREDWGPWHRTAGLTKRADVECDCEQGEFCPTCEPRLRCAEPEATEDCCPECLADWKAPHYPECSRREQEESA